MASLTPEERANLDIKRRGKRRRPKRRWGLRLFFFFLFAAIVTLVVARFSFTLIPPHAVLPSAAVLSSDKRSQLDEALDVDRPLDRDQAIDFALQYTAQSLSFSLRHPTSLEFGPAPRPGNCAEYAALFTAVFEASAKKAGSTARAWRVRSPARVFKKRIPLAAFADHDWILVHDPADGARIYLDPTFYDAWLGASLTRNVREGGSIPIPAVPPPAPAH
ncbi:MAG TPA: hypothetical protein VGI39_14500 [Polyangiaceae bacterium]